MKKNIINITIFFLIICSLPAIRLFSEKPDMIKAERRPAAKMPPISDIFSESFSGDFEEHFLDTFPLRNSFRTLDAAFRKNIMQQSDVNKIYEEKGHLSKIEYPMNEKQILHAANKIEEIAKSTENVYYSVIPDKNYFLHSAKNYPHIDYERLLSIMSQNIKSAKYIDIFDTLTIDNYYKTDTHWRQELILPAAKALLTQMNTPDATLSPKVSNLYTNELQATNSSPISNLYTNSDVAYGGYTPKEYKNFYGVYAVQSAFNIKPETLITLESEKITSATYESIEHEGTFPIYRSEKFEGNDSYDVFLGGAEALIKISRPLTEGEKEKKLVLFRDSFGSSIAPLFLENYTNITLVDLRYISSKLLPEYVDFENSDVLFLYNTQIINNGYLLK